MARPEEGEVMDQYREHFAPWSGMPLLASTRPAGPVDHTGTGQQATDNSSATPFLSLSQRADSELLIYLSARKISTRFLREIDQFLYAHPEIAQHRPGFVDGINDVRPLNAYLFFIKGFTRPARYEHGALSDASNNPLLNEGTPVTVAWTKDTELQELLAGKAHLYNYLSEINTEIHEIELALDLGQATSVESRKLLEYARFGNTVDAFKYYEYNYQTNRLENRYSPTHLVLDELPKPTAYTEPVPHKIGYRHAGEQSACSHPVTRLRMAQALQEGVDVTKVLLTDFTELLVRQRRAQHEIERMRKEAIQSIEHQRQSGGGLDVVDMVMDRALMTDPNLFNHESSAAAANRRMRVDVLKAELRGLLAQEAMAHPNEKQSRPWLPERRADMILRTERSLVHEVVRLAAQGGIMSKDDADRWLNGYTEEAQIERERSGHGRDLLTALSVYTDDDYLHEHDYE